MELTTEQKAKCHGIIHTAATSAGAVGAGLAQIPLSDNALITPIQITMIVSIGAVMNIKLTKSAAAGILSTVVAGTIGRGISQVLFGWIPVWGNTINATTAVTITEAAGWAVVKYFESLPINQNEPKTDNTMQTKAMYEVMIKELLEKIQSLSETIKEQKAHDYFTLGSFALGIAAANIDGEINEEERETLQLITVGLGYNLLPKRVKDKIDEMFNKKPPLNDAIKLIKKVDKQYWNVFNDIVDTILSLDDNNVEAKEVFRATWKKFYEES